MPTDVILRADDVKGPRLRNLWTWFEAHLPDVPVSAFAHYTHTDWSAEEWALAADLVERGWEFGGHTREHPMLSLLSRAEIREAVAENVADIEDGLAGAGLDYSVRSFAYPCGDHDERVVDVLAASELACGLTFPDGYPYESGDAVPEGRDRYRWGVTHAAKFGLDVWNQRFDRVHAESGCYVLCFHPQWWWAFDDEETADGPDDDRYGEEYERLAAHVEYVRGQEDTRLTTYRDALADAAP